MGWDPELPARMPAEDLTVSAVWQINSYNITVNTSEYTPWGTVTGSGIYTYGSTATLTATALENYVFAGWDDFNTDNPRVITVTEDNSFTAYFIPVEVEEIEIPVNDSTMGGVDISFSGSAALASLVEITAIPEPHYYFVNWSDGSTENPRMVTLRDALQLTANFAIEQHTITVISANEAMGTISIEENTGTPSISATFDYGTTVTISANAFAGYEFVEWNDGNTENPRTIILEQDTTFTANFQIADGINDANMPPVNIYSYDNQIIINNAEGLPVEIFDIRGRLIISESIISQSTRTYTIFAPGIYLVKVGDSIVKKVSIIPM